MDVAELKETFEFFDDWEDLWQMGRNLVEPGFGGNRAAEYYKMQGLNPDGTRNLAYPVLLDLDNLIDYMIVTFWVGNFDAPLSNFLGNNRPNNWFGMRDQNGTHGFQFFVHDGKSIVSRLGNRCFPLCMVGDRIRCVCGQRIAMEVFVQLRFGVTA